jgi:hypothetical protein
MRDLVGHAAQPQALGIAKAAAAENDHVDNPIPGAAQDDVQQHQLGIMGAGEIACYFERFLGRSDPSSATRIRSISNPHLNSIYT